MTARDVIAETFGNDEELANEIIENLAASGYAIVPVEPTQAMIDAATTATSGAGCADRDYDDDIRDWWKASITAAQAEQEKRG